MAESRRVGDELDCATEKIFLRFCFYYATSSTSSTSSASRNNFLPMAPPLVERGGVRVAATRTVRMKATLKFRTMSHHWNLIGEMTVYSPLAVLHKIVQSGREENHRNTVADSHGRSFVLSNAPIVLSNTPQVRGQFDLPPSKTHHLPTLITNHHHLRFD